MSQRASAVLASCIARRVWLDSYFAGDGDADEKVGEAGGQYAARRGKGDSVVD